MSLAVACREPVHMLTHHRLQRDMSCNDVTFSTTKTCFSTAMMLSHFCKCVSLFLAILDSSPMSLVICERKMFCISSKVIQQYNTSNTSYMKCLMPRVNFLRQRKSKVFIAQWKIHLPLQTFAKHAAFSLLLVCASLFWACALAFPTKFDCTGAEHT